MTALTEQSSLKVGEGISQDKERAEAMPVSRGLKNEDWLLWGSDNFL